MSQLSQLKSDLRSHSNSKLKAFLPNFFKTGKGQYGEGDQFLGVSVPNSRKVAKKHKSLPLQQVKTLLKSKIHEERLVACLLLVQKYQSFPEKRKEIANYYISHAKLINNWDLVDLTAPKILGSSLLEKKDRSILYKFSRSKNLWEKRISIISTLSFLQNHQFQDTIKISKILLSDKHDLIHKAVGWMLRELGKRDLPLLESFLKKHYKTMPRTMLRYSIEKFPETKRQEYLKGKI